MSGTITLARPYSKAIFEYALEKNKLALWSQVLHNLAMVMKDKEAKQFLSNPNVTQQQQVELLQVPFLKTVSPEDLKYINNMLELITVNKRTFLLPEIALLFDLFRAENEKTMQVNVRSFSPLTSEQQQKLKEKLTKRLNREITLNVTIDSSLIGGAIIQANNLVIDGSVRSQLEKLRVGLIA